MIFRVNTYDIDVAGHLNNIVYIRWLEDLRIKHFSKLCDLKKLLANNYYLFVVSSEMKYKLQIKLFDKPVGCVSIERTSHGIIDFKYEIKVEGQTAFTAMQRCTLVNLDNNKMYSGNLDSFISKLK